MAAAWEAFVAEAVLHLVELGETIGECAAEQTAGPGSRIAYDMVTYAQWSARAKEPVN